MIVSITSVPVGTQFVYKDETWVVTDRDGYPMIEAHCVSHQKEHDMVFWDFQKVEVADDALMHKPYFEETSKHHFELRETLVPATELYKK